VRSVVAAESRSFHLQFREEERDEKRRDLHTAGGCRYSWAVVYWALLGASAKSGS
jgi:hypothetical protein